MLYNIFMDVLVKSSRCQESLKSLANIAYEFLDQIVLFRSTLNLIFKNCILAVSDYEIAITYKQSKIAVETCVARSLAQKLPFDAMNAVLWPLPAYIPNQASKTSVAA